MKNLMIILVLFPLMGACNTIKKQLQTSSTPSEVKAAPVSDMEVYQGTTTQDHFVVGLPTLQPTDGLLVEVKNATTGTSSSLNKYEYSMDQNAKTLRFENGVIIVSPQQLILTGKCVAPSQSEYKISLIHSARASGLSY